MRTSERRDTNFLRQLWKLLLQCHMDYGSVLWSPVGRKDVKFQEGPLRTFTKRGKGIYELNYWEHLEVFRLLSIERRTERYKILYIWKSVNNLVPLWG